MPAIELVSDADTDSMECPSSRASLVNTTHQMLNFRGAKRVDKIATGKSYDVVLQHDNKMRKLFTKQKSRKVQNLRVGDIAQRECQ